MNSEITLCAWVDDAGILCFDFFDDSSIERRECDCLLYLASGDQKLKWGVLARLIDLSWQMPNENLHESVLTLIRRVYVESALRGENVRPDEVLQCLPRQSKMLLRCAFLFYDFLELPLHDELMSVLEYVQKKGHEQANALKT